MAEFRKLEAQEAADKEDRRVKTQKQDRVPMRILLRHFLFKN